MPGLDHIDEDVTGTVFRDVIFLALAGFVAVVLLLLPHLNPPATAEAGTPTQGNVIVELSWPNEAAADIDLWVQAPGDVPVGYSNKGGLIFNLLRDDLGHQGDVTGINYEVSYSRGMPAGEYTVNVHLYRNSTAVLPLEVSVVVSAKATAGSGAERLLTTRLPLAHAGQEVTVFRFELDGKGRLVPGSVHDLPKPLRKAPETG